MVAWAGIIGAALFGRAAAQVGSWSMYAGYEPASDVGPHSMIDLDMEELENFVGNYDSTDGTEATWRADALFVYENGGNGVCATADENGIGCAVGGAKGNSLKSSSIRTLCLLYTSPSPRDRQKSRMPSSA